MKQIASLDYPFIRLLSVQSVNENIASICLKGPSLQNSYVVSVS